MFKICTLETFIPGTVSSFGCFIAKVTFCHAILTPIELMNKKTML